VCPAHAIKFVDRWNRADLKAADEPRPVEAATGRRRFLAATFGLVGGAAGGAGLVAGTKLLAGPSDHSPVRPIVRPPGSVPEAEFLRLCVRCGECFQACPNNVLQPVGFDHGWEALWTPQVAADWSGCEPSCSNCGQVCPTGAIRALPLEEKRVARMGLAVVNQATCLPYAGREECRVCVDECVAAGYQAIEFVRVGTEMDALGQPLDGTGRLAPLVLADKCVGCGLCQTRCYAVNVKAKGLLAESAIRVEAGGDKEDRLIRGSYRELRAQEHRKETDQRGMPGQDGPESGYLPDFLDP
jgi:ferredoxin